MFKNKLNILVLFLLLVGLGSGLVIYNRSVSNNQITSTKEKIFNLDEITKRSKSSDCWIAKNNKVYDLTLITDELGLPDEDAKKFCGKVISSEEEKTMLEKGILADSYQGKELGVIK
ncbi:MAG: hypothetical protein ACRCXZ_09800 [Patescibacteria group bacterium]